MLASLRIKNLALVEDLTLELPGGYLALTGETGAGKSVLIGALTLLLGERADRTLIRSGEPSCTVEAVFDISRLEPELPGWLAAHGLEPGEDHQLLLKRTFTTAGTNRQFVNGSPTTLQTLAELGEWLVDLHGPHEHQSLLHPARQLELLDAFGRLQDLRDRYRDLARQQRQLLEARATLTLDASQAARQLDLLRHQVGEIEAARLQPSEEEELPREHHRAANAARLLELAQSALSQLSDHEDALDQRNGALGRTLLDLQHLDPAATPLVELQSQTAALLQELQSSLRHYLDRVEIDPDRLGQLEERLGLVQGLKRKYGPNIEAVLQFGREARQQMDALENRESEHHRLAEQLRSLDALRIETGRQLTAQRRKTLPRLARAVTRELTDLGFRQSRFEISLASTDPEATAATPAPVPPSPDRIEFQFSPNPGEPLKPLRAIASSGEIARVMLAIKTVLADLDRVPVLIFDEVDANIGGEVAHAVGEKMSRLGSRRQVICITHLAPVAARAGAHFVVTKTVGPDRTNTLVDPVTGTARVGELARMLGGQGVEARQLAESLLRGGTAP